MKIFVTGGTGFIGSHFLKKCANSGIEVVALRRSKNSLCKINLSSEPNWIEGDLSSVQKRDFKGIDCLVHLASAGVSEKLCWTELLRVNVLESVNLWLNAANAGVKNFLICGSCFEYGKSGDCFDFIPTDAPLLPATPYASSKAAATMSAIGLATERNVSVKILRPFHVYGEGESSQRLWPSLRKAALSGEDFRMTKGEQIRDFVHVTQVAEELGNHCLNWQVPQGQVSIKNLGTARSQTLIKFCKHWWTRWDATGTILPGTVPYRPNEVMRYVPKIN